MRKSNKKKEEQELIRGCANGERKSQELLYARYSSKMYAICYRYTKDLHQAEDVLQDGFVKVFRNIHKFRGDGSFEGWVKRIFINTSIEHYRKAVAMYPITDFENVTVPPINNHILEKIAAEELMKMVQQLADGYRTIFNLYVVEGYPHGEIAKMLNISEGTSKSQLARARYILQKMIKQRTEDEGFGEAYG